MLPNIPAVHYKWTSISHGHIATDRIENQAQIQIDCIQTTKRSKQKQKIIKRKRAKIQNNDIAIDADNILFTFSTSLICLFVFHANSLLTFLHFLLDLVRTNFTYSTIERKSMVLYNFYLHMFDYTILLFFAFAKI